MKKIGLFIFIILLPLLNYSRNIEKVAPNNPQEYIVTNILDSIQSKIYNAFVKDMMTQKNIEMTKLNNKLLQLSKDKSNNLISYWQGYLQFYQGILYMQIKKNENARDEINRGIEILSEIKNKTAEDYALLSRLQSISLPFAGMKVISLSKAMSENSKKALELDPENLRTNFVYGSIDFYMPEMYGGGKEAEKYLLKAISLPDQKIINNFRPSWGKDEAYELLIKLYIKKGSNEKAKQYFQKAIKLYPKSFMIKDLEEKINQL